MKKHLAVFHQFFLDLILAGKKTIESRFSQKKIAPYGQISKGDLILMKKAGGNILGKFLVGEVHEFNELDSTKMKEIKIKYGKEMVADADSLFWKKRSKAKFATLIFIEKVERCKIPFSKKDRRSWIVL